MKYLLDTNICIAFLNQRQSSIGAKLREHSPGEVGLCSIVKAELIYGARYSQNVEKNLGKLTEFFSYFESLPFDDAAADHYGMIYATLRASGKIIGLNDMLIASIALAHDLIVVTRNTKEYVRVAGLRLEEW